MKTSVIVPILSLLSAFLVSCSKPEDTIVNHVEKVDSIMQSNMDSPEKGVEKLIEYFEDHGSEAAAQMVDLGVELSQIEGNGDREERVKEVREAFDKPIKNLEGTATKFGDKVKSNSEARKRVEEYGERWEEVFKTLSQYGGGSLPF